MKEIPGFSRYVCTSDGKIISTIGTEKIMKPVVTKKANKSYFTVGIVDDSGKRRRMSIHRLVAITYISNVTNKPCVNHKDSDTFNNDVNNLEWCTHLENLKHSLNCGNFKTGSKHPNSKLNNEEIKKMRILLNNGISCSKIAKIYKVSRSTVDRIKHGKRYK